MVSVVAYQQCGTLEHSRFTWVCTRGQGANSGYNILCFSEQPHCTHFWLPFHSELGQKKEPKGGILEEVDRSWACCQHLPQSAALKFSQGENGQLRSAKFQDLQPPLLPPPPIDMEGGGGGGSNHLPWNLAENRRIGIGRINKTNKSGIRKLADVRAHGRKKVCHENQLKSVMAYIKIINPHMCVSN